MESWEKLREEIISCRRCPRLISYIEEVGRRKVRRFKDQYYWSKPLPGFGDTNARLLIVGLAPAAHGGNRTGRMFTGDSSAQWLAKALYETGFANKPYSVSKDDGLTLDGVYITAVVRCAPPQNRPVAEEIKNCRPYLIRELSLLKNLKVILCLGHIAFNGTLKALQELFPSASSKGLKFKHGKVYKIEGLPYTLLASYHPSKQNTQTGRLKWEEWISVFKKAKELLKV